VTRDRGIRDNLLATLAGWANWQGDGKHNVAWVNNLPQQHVQPEDCVVYFVRSFSDGVVQSVVNQLPTARRATLAPTIAAAQNPSNLTLLGLTVPDSQQGSVSEVYMSKCLTALFPLHSRNPGFTSALAAQYVLLLAVTALHEVMHNKVEPQMGANWNLHTQGGGGIAPGIQVRGGQVTSLPLPTNLNLLAANFNSAHPQFIAA
jgi:hypothetical protein